MPDWNAPGVAKPGTPLTLPLPSAVGLPPSSHPRSSEETTSSSCKSAVSQFRDQVQADLQYLYCHIIRYVGGCSVLQEAGTTPRVGLSAAIGGGTVV